MPATDQASNVTAQTQFLTVKDQKCAYRRFGSGKVPDTVAGMAKHALAFREWEKFTGKRFGDLASILQPALVVN